MILCDETLQHLVGNFFYIDAWIYWLFDRICGNSCNYRIPVWWRSQRILQIRSEPTIFNSPFHKVVLLVLVFLIYIHDHPKILDETCILFSDNVFSDKNHWLHNVKYFSDFNLNGNISKILTDKDWMNDHNLKLNFQ